MKKIIEKEGGKKKKKEMITVEVKKDIIKRHEKGMKVAEIARLYKRSTSTICTVLKKKEILRGLDVAKGVTRVSKQRPHTLEDVETLLSVWVSEKQIAGDTLNENLICAKAKALYADLLSNLPDTSTENEEDFKASRGWYENFKKRSGIHCVPKRGAASGSDAKSADAFVVDFQKLMVSECYLPQQVFNCDETDLFWEKMPKGTYITAEEDSTLGRKPVKDHLTLLLCANASGDFKAKPLLVYHSEYERAFKMCKVLKKKLNTMWRSNSIACVTRVLFVEWINKVFGPAVRKYLSANRLPLKVLLVMDKAPAHHPGLGDDLQEEFQFIKVKFLPPSATLLLQPMNQQVISNFKKLYSEELHRICCFEVTEGTNLNLGEHWKNSSHVVNCLKGIGKAWDGVTKGTLNSAWSNLWPGCLEGFAHEQELPDVEEIVSLGKTMELEVNEGEIQEEPIDVDREQPQEIKVEMLSKVEEKQMKTSPSSNEIRQVCEMWETLQSFVERHHPSRTAAVQAMKLFNSNAMSYFREILKKEADASVIG